MAGVRIEDHGQRQLGADYWEVSIRLRDADVVRELRQRGLEVRLAPGPGETRAQFESLEASVAANDGASPSDAAHAGDQ
jgi:hypothetical protein